MPSRSSRTAGRSSRTRRAAPYEWDPAKVAFHLEPEQEAGKTLKGTELQKRLEGKPVLNANLLDYLLAHTEAIPEEWKQDENGDTRYICFWGTVYRGSSGRPSVRCLYWGDGRWDWNDCWLESGFDDRGPSAVLASI